MVLHLLLFSGCNGCAPSVDDSGLVSDTNVYRLFPVLEQVSATCEDGEVVVRARSRGWLSGGQIEIWDGAGGYARSDGDALHTISFLEDQRCDVVEFSTAHEDTVEGPALMPCDAATLPRFTFLAQIWFEKECAGIMAWGPDAQCAYAGTIQPPPADTITEGEEDDCVWTVEPAVDTGDTDCLPEGATSDDPFDDAEVVTSVATCTE